MPLRYQFLPAAIRPGLTRQQRLRWVSQSLACHYQRPFHSTSPLLDDEIDRATNHYEILKLVPGATVAEIKKSFYALSKTHHPDHNPNDPNASSRFMRISEAYSTLSSSEKRIKYDRDVLGLHRRDPHTHARSGSYSSTTMNPAGGRPATGLSRRRGTFTGPPPSFYRSGGWGAHSAKRSAAHDDSTGSASSAGARAGAKDHHNDGAWATGDGGGANDYTAGGGAGGMGPGQNPFGHRDDVPHFDAEGHERTGRRNAERRMRRTRVDGQEVETNAERGAMGMFFVIGGVLILSCLGPYVFTRLWNQSGRKNSSLDRKSKNRTEGT